MNKGDEPDIGEIRGEKVTFRRQDIVSLEAMPSAKAGKRIKLPRGGNRGLIYWAARLLMGLLVFSTIGIAAGVYAIDKGLLDASLTERASEALNKALAPDFSAQVGSAGIRLGANGQLAIEAREVTITKKQSLGSVAEAGVVQLSLAPVALLTGQISVSSIEVKSMRFDGSAFSGSAPNELASFRIADVPQYLNGIYSKLDDAIGVIAKSGIKNLRLDSTQFSFRNAQGRTLDVNLSSLSFLKNDADRITAAGTVLLNNKPMDVALDIELKDSQWSAAKVIVSGADISPLTMRTNLAGIKHDGFQGEVRLESTLRRELAGQEPELSAILKTDNALIFADGRGQEFTTGTARLRYDFAKQRIEIEPSEFVFGTTRLPLEAVIYDRKIDAENPDPGFSLSVLTSNALADVKASGEQPLPFDFIAEGNFTPKTRKLVFSKLQVSTPGGIMAGSAAIHFIGRSPEISMAAEAETLNTQAVKQLWPYWIASKVRKWALANIFDGKISNASIAIFIPQDRMYLASGHLDLDENQLKLAFDAEDLRLNIPGDMPPLRDAAGHLEMKGGHVSINIAKGNAYLTSGRVASVENSVFEIKESRIRPLMVDLSLQVSGKVDALAELSSFKPIEALKTTAYTADDFTGTAKAQINATFGLIKEQYPPSPIWSAAIDLKETTLSKPLAGHKISSVNGLLTLDPSSGKLEGQGKIDGVALKIAAKVPLKPGTGEKSDINVSGILGAKDLKVLAPGLAGLVQGSVAVDISQTADNQQTVKLDLAKTVLTVPWVGWSKGNGVPAKAAFKMQSAEGITQISDLVFSGDGFGLSGKLELTKQGLNSAAFNSVKLSSADSFALTLKKKNEDYRVGVTGKSIDLRPLLAKLKDQSPSPKGDTSSILVTADLERATGFQGESINNLKVEYGSNSGSLTRLKLTGVSNSGQAIVANLAADGDGKSVQLTAGDGGALARFADIYKNMQNGLLNLRLKQQGPGQWSGNIDIRKFQLVNEERLQTIVSTPAGEDGKSLNQALKRDIDVRSEKFSRGFANLIIKNGVIQIDKGVVRGEQVGATFQGTVRDANGNTDMKGTFMPAYGLNRLFAELPVIGLLLGNGADRGLLGITFKLSGPFEKPELTINPFSLIAPGVFRSIFEFQ